MLVRKSNNTLSSIHKAFAKLWNRISPSLKKMVTKPKTKWAYRFFIFGWCTCSSFLFSYHFHNYLLIMTFTILVQRNQIDVHWNSCTHIIIKFFNADKCRLSIYS